MVDFLQQLQTDEYPMEANEWVTYNTLVGDQAAKDEVNPSAAAPNSLLMAPARAGINVHAILVEFKNVFLAAILFLGLNHPATDLAIKNVFPYAASGTFQLLLTKAFVFMVVLGMAVSYQQMA